MKRIQSTFLLATLLFLCPQLGMTQTISFSTMPLKEAVSRSEVLAAVSVSGIIKRSAPDPGGVVTRKWAEARIFPLGKEIKGTWSPMAREEGLCVPFLYLAGDPRKRSYHPHQLVPGKTYLAFLAKISSMHGYLFPTECEYVLAGDIMGAFPLEDIDDVELDSLKQVVAADAKLEAEFKYMRAEFALVPPVRSQGEALQATFRLINDGDSDVTIPVVGNGKDPFRFIGWAYVHVERIDQDKDPARSPQWVGGLNTTETTTVPAHDSVEWHGNLFVSDYDKGPGTFRYTWEIGKAISNTVEVQVVGEE